MKYVSSGRIAAHQGANASSLPTNFEPDGFRAVDHVLERHPTAPEHQPAGAMIALAVLVTAQAGQSIEEVMHAPIHPFDLVTPRAQDGHVAGVHDLRGRAFPGVATPTVARRSARPGRAETSTSRLSCRGSTRA